MIALLSANCVSLKIIHISSEHEAEVEVEMLKAGTGWTVTMMSVESMQPNSEVTSKPMVCSAFIPEVPEKVVFSESPVKISPFKFQTALVVDGESKIKSALNGAHPSVAPIHDAAAPGNTIMTSS